MNALPIALFARSGTQLVAEASTLGFPVGKPLGVKGVVECIH